jgi:hypothetical protein
MNDFNTLFPNFLNQCAELNRVLTPVACVLFVIGIVSSTVTGHRSPSAYLRTIARTCAYVAVLALLLTWGSETATAIDRTVKNTLQADPAGVYDQYQKALTMQKGISAEKKSWWDLLDSQAIFEQLLSWFLWVVGWLASVIVFYAYLAQKFILYLGYGFAPLFVGFLAVRTLHSIGVSYLLGFAGVLCWPIGWGAASIMTKGLLDFMSDQSFLTVGGAGGAFGYALQNLLGVAVLGIWLIFSTIAAPIIIQKAISTGAQIGQALAGGAVTAGSAAAVSGAGAATAFGGGGGFLGTLAGVGAGATSAAVGATEASLSGSSYSPMGSLLSSLAHQRRGPRKPPRNNPDDITGDQAAQDVLRRKRN